MIKRCVFILVITASLFGLGIADVGDAKTAECNGYYVAPIGPCIPEPLATYWQQHGSVVGLGNPISDAAEEQSGLDGKTYLTQYFEQAVLEWHPENQPPYNVLLAQVGTFSYHRKHPNGAVEDFRWPSNNHYFKETGYTLGGAFYAYWMAHGGLARNGLPISVVFKEASAYDGKDYYVQYFERAEFQWRPEKASTINEVLNLLLGQETYEASRINGSALKIADISTLKSYHISAEYSTPGPYSLTIEGDIVAPDKARMTITQATSGVTSTIFYTIIGDDAYTSLPGGAPVKGGGGKYIMRYYLSQFISAYNKVSSYNGYELVGGEAIADADCVHYRSTKYSIYSAEEGSVLWTGVWVAANDHTIRQLQTTVVLEGGYIYSTSFSLSQVNGIPDISP